MIKRYCDNCKSEIKGFNALQMRVKGKSSNGIKIEIVTGFDKTWNTGDACERCFRAAINEVLDHAFRVDNKTLNLTKTQDHFL